MNRKDFFKTSFAGAAAVALAGGPVAAIASSCTSSKPRNNTELKLSFQSGKAIGDTYAEKFDYMESLGIVGFEPGGGELVRNFDELSKALEGRNIKLSAICAGFEGFILAEDGQKDAFDKSMRTIVDAAGALGSTGVIMVPAFVFQNQCKPHTPETRQYLCDQLYEHGQYALAAGTTVILEPLNREEAFYLRLVSDAAAICRDCGSDGVKCMGDFWHMKEETSDYAAFMSAGPKYLQHVHIASRGRRINPGEDGDLDNYVSGFRALKEMGYQNYVSFECGTAGDPAVTTPAAVALLREQWKQA